LTKIYLIRHAEAEGNIYRRAHGHFNGRITARGYNQIAKLRDRFEKEDLSAIYSSDLLRASVTAVALSKPRGLALNLTKNLREVNMGVWEDVAWGDLEYQYPEMSRHFNDDPANWKVSGSEQYEVVQKRIIECLTEIGNNHDGETVAVFSHGFAIRSLMCERLGVPSHESQRVKYCDNTAVALLLYEDGGLKIEYHGDNSHLSREDSTFAHQNWWRSEKDWVRENLRYMLLDEKRDAKMLALYNAEYGERPQSSKEYVGFRANEPAGLIGIDEKWSLDVGNHVSVCSGGSDGKMGVGLVSYVYVLPEFRRNNMGTQLLGHAMSEFRKLGREAVRVEAQKDSELARFCLKYDFVVVGESGHLCVMEKNIRNW